MTMFVRFVQHYSLIYDPSGLWACFTTAPAAGSSETRRRFVIINS